MSRQAAYRCQLAPARAAWGAASMLSGLWETWFSRAGANLTGTSGVFCPGGKAPN
jgi:hypothetical protein